MPVCNKCNKNFKNNVIIDGKLRNLQRRKFCLDCSPWNQHNTKNINNPIYKESTRICLVCNKSYIYKRSCGHTINKCNSCLTLKRRHEFKRKCVDYMGGKCSKCNYFKCLNALHFHHLDSSKKDFSISKGYCKKWDNLVKELDKCILVCANCHAELHDEKFIIADRTTSGVV